MMGAEVVGDTIGTAGCAASVGRCDLNGIHLVVESDGRALLSFVLFISLYS